LLPKARLHSQQALDRTTGLLVKRVFALFYLFIILLICYLLSGISVKAEQCSKTYDQDR